MENTKTNENLNVAVKYSGFDTLKEALEAHRAWILNKEDGKCANLSRADLGGAILRGANLSDTNLSNANLSRANLSEAKLSAADLSGANLSGANLSRADLSRADLGDTNLSNAYLRGANLSDTNLSSAILSGAILSGANLSGVDLSSAYLSGANLSGANLENGLSWERYLSEVVPDLCIAGGKSLEEVAAVWDCHSWENCPMHVAFGVNSIDEIPEMHRLEVERFVMFFDQKLIPRPVVE